jgi:hypothetical protein
MLKSDGKLINLEIELDTIKDFFNKVSESVDAQTTAAFKLEKAGKLYGFDDLSNELSSPLEQEAIAIRAVYYELNALIEWELQSIALNAYFNSDKYKKHKKSFSEIKSLDEIKKVKLLYDLAFSDICELIEDYHQIHLSNIPKFENIQIIRQSVNAFKHRKGFKDIRRDKEAKILDKFAPSRKEAYTAIEHTKIFLKQLWEDLGNKSI